MSRLRGNLAKRVEELTKQITGVVSVEVVIIDEQTGKEVKRIKPSRRAQYELVIRI